MFWEDLSDEEKAEVRRQIDSDLRRLNDPSIYPINVIWGGYDPITILGPAHWFHPYNDPKYGHSTWKSNWQLMSENKDGNKAIVIATSCVDSNTGLPLVRRAPNWRIPPPDPFDQFFQKTKEPTRKNPALPRLYPQSVRVGDRVTHVEEDPTFVGHVVHQTTDDEGDPVFFVRWPSGDIVSHYTNELSRWRQNPEVSVRTNVIDYSFGKALEHWPYVDTPTWQFCQDATSDHQKRSYWYAHTYCTRLSPEVGKRTICLADEASDLPPENLIAIFGHELGHLALGRGASERSCDAYARRTLKLRVAYDPKTRVQTINRGVTRTQARGKNR